jgi:uncharacterized protein YbjT (DUF2867 family)
MARILVTGATGFIGKRLVGALVEAGHDVKAMTRHPETYDGPGRPVRGDVGERASLTEPLEDVDVAYYLVHSLDNTDFEERDADAARMFAKVAEKTGVEQIVYLGGLGNEHNGALSAHLRSRREVEGLLGSTGIPVTVLRAAIVVGKGGISWEMTRQLVKKLPAMVVPKWVGTRTQPIGIDDVVSYLVGVAGNEKATGSGLRDRWAGGADLRGDAPAGGHGDERARAPVVQVPVLTPRLSSYWLALVTDVDVTTGRNLIDSMGTEVVVTDDAIKDVVPLDLASYQETVRRALEDDRQTED